MTDVDDRWAQAQALLDGAASDAARQRLRRGQRHLLLILGAVCLASLGCAVAVTAWSGDGLGSGSDDDPLWRSVTGLVVMLSGLVLLGPAVFRQLRENRWRDGWRTPLLALDVGQRRHLAAQVTGRVPADPAHLPLARHLARTLVRQSPTPKMALGLMLLATGQLIGSPSWWWAALLALLLVGWPAASRKARRAQEFLDAHPADSIP